MREFQTLRAQIQPFFNLVSDQAAPADIDVSIRAGVLFRGTNLWILICATFVASIGLNMNSGAVIIGAMLISPLMGPIMGIGYGAGVNDVALIRSAAKNLAVAVLFSLLTSALYFLLTPLSEARSEILARTSPTIWDVLIALFGGLAGIIGSTRREKSNVIPGVAIATALMPPLCTAGFGIATWQPYYILGAMYLFAINSVFIAAASFIMVRQMRLPEVTTLDEPSRARTRKFIWLIVVLTVVPSVYLAYRLVQKEVFISRAERFVTAAFPNAGGTFVVGQDLDLLSRTIRLNVIGEALSEDALFALEHSLTSYRLEGARLEIVQSRRDEVDIQSLRMQVTGDLFRDTLVALDEKNRRIAALELELASAIEAKQSFGDVIAELRASHPQIADIGVGLGTTSAADGTTSEALLITMVVTQPLLAEDQVRIEAWLKVRTKHDTVQLFVTVAPSLAVGTIP